MTEFGVDSLKKELMWFELQKYVQLGVMNTRKYDAWKKLMQH